MMQQNEYLMNLMNRNTVADIPRRNARKYPNKVCLIYRDTRLTYTQLHEQSSRLANSLIDLGYKKGDKAAVILNNSCQYMVVIYALAKAGLIEVPINLMLKPHEMSYLISHSESTVAFIEDGLVDPFYEKIQKDIPNVKNIISIPLRGANVKTECLNYDDLIAESLPEEPQVILDDKDIALLAYTSGTEALPKGVLISHESIMAQYVNVICDSHLSHSDIGISVLPLFHNAALQCVIAPRMYVGGTVVILEKFDSKDVLETIQREKATSFFGLPLMYRAMLETPGFDQYDLTSLRACVYTIAPMPVPMLKECMEKFHADFMIPFGQTEVTGWATCLKADEQLTKPGSLGNAGINMEIAIMDDDGNFLPPGEVGELMYRGKQCMRGYFKDEGKTKEAFKYGWLHSGDLGHLDEDGYFYFADRKKDMIKTGGENVSTLEVEKVILMHPCVQDAAIIGVPDKKWSEAICAVVIPKDKSLKPDEIISYCKSKIGGYKVPKHVIFTEMIEKSSTGKIQKAILRKKYAPQFEHQ